MERIIKNPFVRMQKVALATLCITCIFRLFANDLNAQTTEKVTWDYPVRYGTPKWDDLRTFEEKFNAYNIPDEILKEISTKELVKTCLSYPQWGLIHAYNDRRTRFSVIVSLFNGFRELFSRNDAVIELLKVYDKLDPLSVDPNWTDLQKGEYCFQFTKIELFLSPNPMIDQLDKDVIQYLKEAVISKYQKKKVLPEIYSLWDLSPIVAICLNIIEKDNTDIVKNIFDANYLKTSLMSEDIQFLDNIVELLKKNNL